MSQRGKNINLFLTDGTASGIVKCTLSNWLGIAYRIPRTELNRCKDRKDLKQSGVYFLFGGSDNDEKNFVYIGQAGERKNGEGILNRLYEHNRSQDRDYWTETIVFTTSNNSFGPTEISYLENRFCKIATEINRYIVKNSNEPSPGHITEEKESELEEFIDNSVIIMGALGHKIFEPLIIKKKNTDEINFENEEEVLYFKRKSRKSDKTINAKCMRTKEGFVVLRGSEVEMIDSKTIPFKIKQKRKKAVIDDNGVLQEDLLFKSPSYAAAFIIGGHVNGLKEWKTKEGISLKEIDSIETSKIR